MGIIKLPICYNFFRQSRSRVERTTGAQTQRRGSGGGGGKPNPRGQCGAGDRGAAGPGGGGGPGAGAGGNKGGGARPLPSSPAAAGAVPGAVPLQGQKRGTKMCPPFPLSPLEETHSEIYFIIVFFLNAPCCLRGGEAPPCPKRVFIFMRARVNKDKSPL